MRRPSFRSLAGGAAGITAGVIGGVVLTSVSAAGPTPVAAGPPQVSLPLRDPVTISLGLHTFGVVREPDAHAVAAAWGSGGGEVGLAGSRELGFSGPSSFDVEADGTVDVLDSVNGRVARWPGGRPQSVPLSAPAELADFAAEPDGGFDVLDLRGTLRSYRADGT